MKRLYPFVFLLFYFCTLSFAGELTLQRDGFRIAIAQNADPQVMLAAQTLAKDVQMVMGFTPKIGPLTASGVQLCIVQGDKEGADAQLTQQKELDGWESHRVFADADHNRIYLYGYDMRGTIYAIYTFSEEVLGVPPYYYYCSFNPVKRQEIAVPGTLDIFYPTPDVRYRTWFPNDQDLWNPFQNSEERKGKLLETLLRMKMNTIEHGSCVDMKNKTLNADARRMRDYGVVLTNHHMIFLNNDWGNWDSYWRDIRGYSTPPARSTKNFEQMKEFFAYSIDCTLNSNVECLWQIACRGINDHPFWEYIDDSPSSSSERGAFITKVVNAQYDLIKQKTGEQDPFVRMTFYNEVSDFLAQGYVQPPVASNMLWTYVAARRNHYPAADLQKHDKDVKLGYYFNFQFTSTGSHLAPAEGPWKMEDNYRYLRSKGPVTFSVVNMGNFREYWFDAYCNAKMLWNFLAYDTDQAVYDFCAQYFGEEHAQEAAQIYHDYFYSYWEMQQPDFTCIDGLPMERQYIMQDLRYSRCIGNLAGKSWSSYNENPFDASFDGVPRPMVPNVINGMAEASRHFADVQERAERLYQQMDSWHWQFFYDHCLAYIRFMGRLSECLYHEAYAYKNAGDDRAGHANMAWRSMEAARAALLTSQHDIYATWYSSDSKFGLNSRVNGTKGKADDNPLTMLEMEDADRTGSTRVVSGTAYSGGKTVHGAGNGSTVVITYDAPSAGVYDMMIQYASQKDARVEATANGISLSRTFPATGSVTSLAVGTVQVNLLKGENVITLDNSEGECPDMDAYALVRSAWITTDAPHFDAINPGHGRYVGLDYQGHSTANLFYLYNIGQKKYVKTGGVQKVPDTPVLVDRQEEATPQRITLQDDDTYLIADPDWRSGWGVQGRQVLSISTNGTERTASWGSNLTPGWVFRAVPNDQTTNSPNNLFITYTWADYEPGIYAVEDPTGQTYALYYGPYAQSTAQWNRTAQNDVKADGIYGTRLSDVARYGNNALWQVIPVNDDTISVLPNEPSSIRQPQTTKRPVPQTTSYNLQGQRVSDGARGLLIANGKKHIQ